MKAMLVPQRHHCHSSLPFPPQTLAPHHPPFPAAPLFRNPRAPTVLFPRFSAHRSEAVPQSAIQRIAEKLRSLGFKEDDDGGGGGDGPAPKSSPGSAGEIFVPLPKRLPKYRVGHTIDTSWSTPENPVPEPGSGGFVERYGELRRRARKERELERELEREKRRREEKVAAAPTLAELRLSEEERRRLIGIGVKLKKRLKIGKAGITEGIVNGIHERWRRTEVVKITCEDLCRMNMKRTHDLLEVCLLLGVLLSWNC